MTFVVFRHRSPTKIAIVNRNVGLARRRFVIVVVFVVVIVVVVVVAFVVDVVVVVTLSALSLSYSSSRVVSVVWEHSRGIVMFLIRHSKLATH